LLLENDKDIVREYKEGNSEIAATAFVRKHQKFVFATALRYVQNYDDADDASQEVFIKALKNLYKFRGESSLKTWLYRITVNVCSNMIRKRKVLQFLSFEKDEENYYEMPSDDISPYQRIIDQEYEEKFLKSMNKLPEKQRETFALRYFEELTYEEISKLLGTTVGGLKANYYQAVRKMTDSLKAEVFEFEN
jgi:RNA polymerase sigma-70 factor, ECF subfamily